MIYSIVCIYIYIYDSSVYIYIYCYISKYIQPSAAFDVRCSLGVEEQITSGSDATLSKTRAISHWLPRSWPWALGQGKLWLGSDA